MAEEQYHRVESTSQSPDTARLQDQSQEIWGKPARGSGLLSVKAYRGALLEGTRGIDISTELSPEKGSGTPYEARWYYPKTLGTFLREEAGVEFAAIKAKVTNRQP